MATPNFFRFYSARNWETRFHFVATDSADHVSPKSGLTVFTISYCDANGSFQTWPGATVTPIGDGLYYFKASPKERICLYALRFKMYLSEEWRTMETG